MATPAWLEKGSLLSRESRPSPGPQARSRAYRFRFQDKGFLFSSNDDQTASALNGCAPAEFTGATDCRILADSNAVGFLDLPYELRLMVYELVLIDPDPIIISPRRRQIHARVCTRPATNANTYLRARRPTPEKYLVQKEDRLHVGILRACRQVNIEGTALLYGKNRFIVGRK